MRTSDTRFALLLLALLAGCGGSSSHASPGDPMPAVAGASSAGAAGTPSEGSAGSSTTLAGAGAASDGGTQSSGGSTRPSDSGTGGTSGASTGGASMGGAAGSAGGGAAVGGMGGAAPSLGCASWRLDLTKDSPAGVMVIAGGARFTRPAASPEPPSGYFNGADVAIEQTGLVGDFDVLVSFKDFVPGDGKPFVGPRAEAGVWWHDPVSGRVFQATGSVGQGSGSAVVSHGNQFTLKYLDPSPAADSLVGASGSFQITRAGTTITVKTTVNGELVSAQSEMNEPFSEEPLTLFLSLDDATRAFDQTAKDSAITFTRVLVTGGGGTVKSEDFSCP